MWRLTPYSIPCYLSQCVFNELSLFIGNNFFFFCTQTFKVYTQKLWMNESYLEKGSGLISSLICADHIFIWLFQMKSKPTFISAYTDAYMWYLHHSCHKSDISVKEWFIFKDSYESFQRLFCEGSHLTLVLLQVLCIMLSFRFHLCAQP